MFEFFLIIENIVGLILQAKFQLHAADTQIPVNKFERKKHVEKRIISFKINPFGCLTHSNNLQSIINSLINFLVQQNFSHSAHGDLSSKTHSTLNQTH